MDKTLAEFIRDDVPKHELRNITPSVRLIDDDYVNAVNQNADANFESLIFAYLYENRGWLGIKEVRKYRGRRTDGALLLDDGTLVLIEIKERLNAASAGFAFQQLMYCREVHEKQCDHGIILFRDWAYDWDQIKDGRRFETGWIRFHKEYQFYGMKIDLLKFSGNSLTSYRDVEAHEL